MKSPRWYDYLTINLYWFGLNIRNNAVGGVFLPYLLAAFVAEDVRNTALGTIRTAGLVIAMLVQPAMGILSDRNTSRFGRRRPFIFVGVLLDLLCLAFIAVSWDYTSLLIAILLIQFTANISHGAVQGLIPDLIPEEKRGIASGVKGFMELIPLLLVSLIIARIVSKGGFTLAVFIVGAVHLLIMLLTMALVKETPLKEKPDIPLAPTMIRVLGMLAGILAGAGGGLLAGGALGGLVWLLAHFLFQSPTASILGIGVGCAAAMVIAVGAGVWTGASTTLGWKAAREQTPFIWWIVNRLFFFSALTSIQSFSLFFLMYVFHISREEAVRLNGELFTVVGIFTLLATLPGGALSDRFGRRKLVGISGAVGALGALILLTTIFTPRLPLIYVAGILLGSATGLFYATSWALGVSLVPEEQAGRYLGVSNLAGAGAGMVGTGIGGPIADWINRIQPGMGYFVIFGAYALLLILSVVTLRWVQSKPTSSTA